MVCLCLLLQRDKQTKLYHLWREASSLLNQLYYKLYLYNGPNEQELNQLFMENCASICSLSQSFKSMIHYLCYYIQYMTYHHIYINRNLLTVIPETSYYFESIFLKNSRIGAIFSIKWISFHLIYSL